MYKIEVEKKSNLNQENVTAPPPPPRPDTNAYNPEAI